ncbi:hypothetical protein GCM10009551_105290 [Nocardiopsis tropica]|uniref:hypothetical protein n=1 Tax=Tsukamurella strandjordii TaxID=147577 RepID=UPI0031E39992
MSCAARNSRTRWGTGRRDGNHAIPDELHDATVAAGWSAAAAIFAAYAPNDAISPPVHTATIDELIDRAVAHGDEHAIKLIDTALDVLAWTSDERAVHASLVALDGIAPA